jgi:hypothetical protein
MPDTTPNRTFNMLGFALKPLTLPQIMINAFGTALSLCIMSLFMPIHPESAAVSFILLCLNTAGVRFFTIRGCLLLFATAMVVGKMGELVLPLLPSL